VAYRYVAAATATVAARARITMLVRTSPAPVFGTPGVVVAVVVAVVVWALTTPANIHASKAANELAVFFMVLVVPRSCTTHGA